MSDEKELVVDNSTEVVETSPEPTTTETAETTDNQVVESTRPVETLTQAKEVLKAQKEAKEKATKEKTETTTKTKNDEMDYRKAYEEMQKVHGKTSRELGELRKKDKEYQKMLDAYNAAIQKKENETLAAQYQQDPQAVIRELARREAQTQNQGLQEKVLELEAQSTNSTIQSFLGQDYDTHAPVMKEIIEEAQELDAARGTDWAEKIARDPRTLIALAKEKIAFLQGKSQKQVVDKKKADNLRVANEVAKTNNNRGSAPVDDFKNLSLNEMTAQLKKLGIKK